uniref:Uncharacterized protein n=1 Tax=Anguilla anguilla TaxID=7936 RepID=A0A0E9RGJ0_ANGAN
MQYTTYKTIGMHINKKNCFKGILLGSELVRKQKASIIS